MKPVVPCLRFLSCLVLLMFTMGSRGAHASEPVRSSAWLYVSQMPAASGPNQVFGFAVASDGKLTPAPGSPYAADVNLMVDNGKFLLGATTDNLYLNTYTIEPDGALRFAVANDISHLTGGFDFTGFNIYLDLDHTGATLYDLRFNLNDDNEYLEAYTVDKATGSLKLVPASLINVGNAMTGPGIFTISANNKYIYGVNSGYVGFDLYMFNRGTDGALLNPGPGSGPIVNPKDVSNYGFDPIGISADPSNHVAVAFANNELEEGPEVGPNRLGVFTAGLEGNLTTTSTTANMPKVSVGNVNLKMAPSGKLLAAFGTAGLQIFHFNGAASITNDAVLVSGIDFEQAFWDDNNHLFAVSQNTGKLYVFTVTPNGHVEAPGSPYSIPGAQNLILRIKKQ